MFIIYILPLTVEDIPWGTRAVLFQSITLVTYVKHLNLDILINISKRTKRNGEKERRIGERFSIGKQKYETLLRVKGFR